MVQQLLSLEEPEESGLSLYIYMCVWCGVCFYIPVMSFFVISFLCVDVMGWDEQARRGGRISRNGSDNPYMFSERNRPGYLPQTMGGFGLPSHGLRLRPLFPTPTTAVDGEGLFNLLWKAQHPRKFPPFACQIKYF